MKRSDQPFETDERTERQIDELLAKMTLTEKIGQMTQRGKVTDEEKSMVREGRIGSFLNLRGTENVSEIQRIAVEESRLGIPLIIGDDVIHGYRTIFPIPLAEACSWEPELMEACASIAAKEASADGIHWIFSPMVDIARDPRWGRVAEGAGEDPHLGEIVARAKVRGFQQARAGKRKMAACPKHFAAYGLSEAGRDYNTVDVSKTRLEQVYFPPFRAALDAGAVTIMAAFNDLNGVPCTGNEWLLTDVLQNRWGFSGFVVSDWCSVDELVQHGRAASKHEAAAVAANAGTHMDMHSRLFDQHLCELVRNGKVSEKIIDHAVRRILRVKFWLGLFDQPYPEQNGKEDRFLNEQYRSKARVAARKSIVLLKNENETLPLKKNIRSLAVIGPLADAQQEVLGCWAGQGDPNESVSMLEGIRRQLNDETELLYVRGCNIKDRDRSGIDEAVEAARQADAVVLAVGESADMSGENHNRTSLELPGVQQELVKAVHATGTPTVIVLMNGRPLSIAWEVEHVSSIVETWHLGTEAGNAIADVLFGAYNPSGKLPMTFPRTVGQVPIYYNHKKTGRPGFESYEDSTVDALYPFGYGLSYTRFDYRNLRLNRKRMAKDETISVSVEIANTGDVAGEEIVQLYIGDVAASLTRPVKELKGFKKIALKPGESRRVEFTVSCEQLGFYEENGHFIVEPGEFKLWMGPDSVKGIETAFELTANDVT
ncbi:MAG TPA: glycoside hydrolase family 3 N-terminal domain-containing protein [Bacillales bacterium]|nr:glycoside hydrolase family 3 N-terminal domain-containing protein [Bacillales bacterium]